MKLDPADHERYVSIELNENELALLGDLLRVETIFQIRKQVGLAGDVEARTASIINTFGVFQDFDDQIKDLQADVADVIKLDPTVENYITSLSKNRIKIYHFLCTKTTELTLPPALQKKCKEYGAPLTSKLATALGLSPEPTAPENKADDIKINMLGQRGIA